MEFIKYNSIKNSYDTKFIRKIIENGYDREKWVVTNKIHGANFSFLVNDLGVKCASRENVLNDDSDFYGFQVVRDKYIDNIKILYAIVKSIYDDTASMSVHGEIFGGRYPHPDVQKNPNASKIQKGVYYTPNNDFYLFDIKIDGRFISFNTVFEISGIIGCPVATPLATGSLQECLEYPNDFEDPTYKYYDLPAIENNITEGIVIRPIITRFIGDHRVILKNKNDKWSEKSREKKVALVESVSDEAKSQIEVLSQYVTEQRLDNVLSHIGGVEDKEFGKLIGAYSKDVWDDYFGENEGDFLKLETQDQKIVKNKCGRMCAGFLRPKFRQIVY